VERVALLANTSAVLLEKKRKRGGGAEEVAQRGKQKRKLITGAFRDGCASTWKKRVRVWGGGIVGRNATALSRKSRSARRRKAGLAEERDPSCSEG